MKWLYEVFGVSKQGYHKRLKSQQRKLEQHELVLEEVNSIREEMTQTGTRKLYKHIQPVLKKNNIKMGRDALFTLLRQRSMLVRRTKNFHITTDSNHYFYASPNRIADLEITHAEQAFSSDITYVKTDEGHAYLALVTDLYSKKIMGWSLDNNMKVSLVKEALKMAHKNTRYRHTNIIHHSDRGMQYCCPDYTDLAQSLNFQMSTTQQYDPYENAVAERVNGTLKYEFGLRRTLPNLAIARKLVKQAVKIYNTKRLHWSLDLQTPEHVHRQYNKQKYKSYAKDAA